MGLAICCHHHAVLVGILWELGLSLFLSVSLCVSLSISLSFFSLSVDSLSFIQALATVWLAAKRLGPHSEFPMLAHMVLYISYQKMPFLLGVGAARHTA